MQSWLVLAVSAAYLGVLFAIAWWGDRQTDPRAGGGAGGGRAGGGALVSLTSRWAAVFYALTLCIYNTSWSFYGSVGRASASGFDFLPIYLGPTILLLFARPVFLKTIAITKAQNVTSIADFIGARYGKSQAVAALVTLTALVGVLPYIALQLKAVAASFDVLTAPALAAATAQPPFWGDTAFAVAGAMAVFSILFGVRHINASEHHRGLMLAIAFESLVKLAVFLAVAAFIVYGMFDGFGDLLSRPQAAPLLDPDFLHPTWWSNTAISVVAFLCLPQMFHVLSVENENPRHVRAAAWMYPSYLLALSLLMIPIAVAGLVTFGGGMVNPDTFMITLPIAAGANGFSLLSFIGGLSAATGMVIVAAVSLSTMLCNDVVMPLLLRRPRFAARLGSGETGRDMVGTLLLVRRLSVVGILLLAYAMHRLVDKGYPLTVIGLLSFVAVAQFGPAFFGALYWPRANRVGALAGMGAGFLVWIHTLLVPAMARIVPIPAGFLDDGPWGIGWLAPGALFGIEGLDPISHASLWSLLANLTAFVAGSLLARPSAVERTQAVAYIETRFADREESRPFARSPARLDDLRALAVRFVGAERGNAAFDAYGAGRGGRAGPADLDAVRFTETLIAGAVGAASARVVMAASLQGRSLSRGDAMAMLDEASEALLFNRKLLQETLENIGQGVCVIDAEFRVAAWNRRYLELLDLPADMVRVGVSFGDLIRFNTARGEYGVRDLRDLLVGREAAGQSWPYRYERRRPDGTVLEIVVNPMPEGGYVSTYADVTERYRAAEALREANESLEHRVRERTDALQQAKAEAEAANASKTRFLAAASHDLLQPLNAARLFVSALEESVREAAPGPDQRAAEGAMADNAAAALRSTEMLLGGLLDISSLDAGNVRAKIRTFAIGELLSGLGVEFSALAQERGLTLRVVGCGAVVRSDPQLLRRVLQNFLANAIRYTPKGRVLLGCRRRGGALRIEVWDTGPGIPENKRGEVFEEFRRLGGDGAGSVADHRLGPGGLGLGLAIVDRIAKLLGHPVTLRSTLGRGTGFAVEVPVAEHRAVSAARPAAAPAGQLAGGLLVLCIDNEEAILAGLRALLGQWGCRVATASGVEGALAALDGALPDVVCVDYHVGGGLTGLMVLERLRELWDRPVKGLLITADRSEIVRAEAERAGCGVLYKPVKPASLRRFLNGAALQTTAVAER
ncbi:PAS domain-containing hybrid sensor histidine kinase/response regulator [Azospirillum agricola]|uniref:PAS domain-containing hybrid sensor histidine kinase/response regulator n=1 Tax=Azospirillum agricola TaxID=1720247 RepID=UPI000A0F2820|nr:PAS domain-containing hybrid sensor histidine kinase/response regulator [Azospirillum agricola]SMH33439.1 Na+/proline symporter [Azospirillum lipoferum]